MILSEKFKFYFIHIPRTGGTSVEIALKDIHRIDPTTLKFIDYISKDQHRQTIADTYLSHRHSDQDFVKSVLDQLEYDYTNWYEFTFVRNPYDRIVSLYEFYATKIWKNQGNTKFLTFADFLTQLYNLQRFGNFYKPQTFWLKKSLTCKVNIHKFENLQEEWQYICKKLSLEYKSLPHKNKSEHREPIILTDEQKEKIYEYYKDDFIKFGYDK